MAIAHGAMSPTLQVTRQDGCSSKIEGVGLLEWVVALGLNAVVLLILTQALLSARVSFSMIDATARLSDNGRFALEVIAQSLDSASVGLPCAREEDDPFLTQVSFTHPSSGFLPEAMVVGWEAPNTQGDAWSMHAEIEQAASAHIHWPPALAGRVDPQSDVLMIHYRAPLPGVKVNHLGPDHLYTQKAHGLKSCAVVVLSDCTTDRTLQVSRVTARSLHWSSDGQCAPGNRAVSEIDVDPWSDWPHDRSHNGYHNGHRIALYHWRAVAWFVGPPEGGERTLYRALFDRGLDQVRVEAMVEGIETLQVEFASRHPLNPMAWQSADEVADWSSVVGVRFGLLASARMDQPLSEVEALVSHPLLSSQVSWPANQGYIDSFQTAQVLRGARRLQHRDAH